MFKFLSNLIFTAFCEEDKHGSKEEEKPFEVSSDLEIIRSIAPRHMNGNTRAQLGKIIYAAESRKHIENAIEIAKKNQEQHKELFA